MLESIGARRGRPRRARARLRPPRAGRGARRPARPARPFPLERERVRPARSAARAAARGARRRRRRLVRRALRRRAHARRRRRPAVDAARREGSAVARAPRGRPPARRPRARAGAQAAPERSLVAVPRARRGRARAGRALDVLRARRPHDAGGRAGLGAAPRSPRRDVARARRRDRVAPLVPGRRRPGADRGGEARARELAGPVDGTRFHYLRVTLDNLEQLAGSFRYDASLGYADRLGFRAGIARPSVPGATSGTSRST